MRILVLNSGSSSLKFEVFEAATLASVVAGNVEAIGEKTGRLKLRDGATPLVVRDHAEALARVMEALAPYDVREERLLGIGHRVVHGGAQFRAPTLIDDTVLDAIRATVQLAPLHNPPNLLGIEVARAALPRVPQVAVFDTAFHHQLPPHAWRYALPAVFHEQFGVRRYGFHGTSHAYVARRAAELIGRPLEELKLVTLHLGNGASAAAIAHGHSVDTSMGLTPLEGLVMGSRCGDLDPAAVLFIMRVTGLSGDPLRSLLNERSGLRGLCGDSDMRAVLRRAAAGDEAARAALELYSYRVRKYVGAYAAALGGLDAVVFTAGVGENAAEVRARCCEGLGFLGIELDAGRNEQGPVPPDRELSRPGAPVRIFAIHTEEEREIARLTRERVQEAAS